MKSNLNEINFTEYDPSWPSQFVAHAQQLQTALQSNILQLHHVGSTAIANLAANPVIDILAVVENIQLVDHFQPALAALGYIAFGELKVPFRRIYRQAKITVQFYERDHSAIEQLMRRRDYLRYHSNARLQYENFTRDLCQRHADDWRTYQDQKAEYFHQIDRVSGYQGLSWNQVVTKQEWEAYHRIREQELFHPIQVPYDRNHPSLTDSQCIHFVYKKGTIIIGTAQLEILDPQRATLRTIAIDAPYQRQAHGQRLMGWIERWVRDQGFGVLLLHAHGPTVGFYRKLGFVEMEFPEEDRFTHIEIVDMGKLL